MPIVGLTKDVDGAGVARMPRIGKLHKGAEKPESGDRPGADLGHFRIAFEPEFEPLRPTWEALVGKAPTEFTNVRLAGATVDEVFPNWLEHWKAAVMLHRCDGVCQARFYNTQTHVYINATIPCVSPIDAETGQRPKNCECKAHAYLKLLFPQLIAETGVIGYVEALTTSVNDIMAVSAYLTMIERSYGSLGKIPFNFGRATRSISTPKSEKRNGTSVVTGRAKREKSLFYIHVAPDFAREFLLPAFTGEQPKLPAPAEPIMDTATARAKLGSGKQDKRRLDATQDKKTTPPSFLADDGRRVKFLNWAVERFKLSEELVLQAFGNAQDSEITKVTDWKGDEVSTMAAVVAFACGYDAEAIKKATASGFHDETAPKVHDAALALAEKINALAEEGEGELV